MSVHLVEMGLTTQTIGFIFALMGLSYAIGAVITGYLCSVVSNSVVMEGGLVLLAFSIACAGPSLLLNMPNKIWLIITGTFFIGFFAAFL